jgi:hypothetical protein
MSLATIAHVCDYVLLARKELDTYYTNLASRVNLEDVSARFSPRPTSFSDITAKRTQFTHVAYLTRTDRHLSSDSSQYVPFKLVLTATLSSPSPSTRVVVKLVVSYNADAHRLLAQAGLAPKLLYDGALGANDRLGPDYRVIVMEHVTGSILGNTLAPLYPLVFPNISIMR